MKLSVQTPWRGSQEGYEKLIASLETQTFRDFEFVVANDHYDMEMIHAVPTTFAHKVISMPKRLPGWGYSLARNVCIDHGMAEYLVYLDGDVLLFPDALATVAKHVSPMLTLHGYKHYFDKAGSFLKSVAKRELQVLPYDLVTASGGFDEVYFPWYGFSYRDMIRRMGMIRQTSMKWISGYAGRCVKSEIVYERDSTTNAVLTKRLEKLKTRQPIMRRTVPATVVWDNRR